MADVVVFDFFVVFTLDVTSGYFFDLSFLFCSNLEYTDAAGVTVGHTRLTSEMPLTVSTLLTTVSQAGSTLA